MKSGDWGNGKTLKNCTQGTSVGEASKADGTFKCVASFSSSFVSFATKASDLAAFRRPLGEEREQYTLHATLNSLEMGAGRAAGRRSFSDSEACSLPAESVLLGLVGGVEGGESRTLSCCLDSGTHSVADLPISCMGRGNDNSGSI